MVLEIVPTVLKGLSGIYRSIDNPKQHWLQFTKQNPKVLNPKVLKPEPLNPEPLNF